ncbi:MAG: hypothetical protein JSV91_10635 [Phycisphaerales bacterium]|nr:MAG: hypothetical protein JSV91_10635 [Phycisphaerales bacterium]
MLRRKLTSLAALTATAVLGLAGCSPDTTVSWQDNGTPKHFHPAQTWWNYQYVYYAQPQVYFEPYSHTWYWFEDDLWHQGFDLPETISVYDQTPQVVKLASLPPFEQHDTVASTFGPYFYAYPGSLSPNYAPNAAYARAFANRQAIGQAIDQFMAQSATPNPETAQVFANPGPDSCGPFMHTPERPDVRMTRTQQPSGATAYATAESGSDRGF